MRRTKKELIAEVAKWSGLYTSSLNQLREALWVETELENYKDYLEKTRASLKKVRKERDLAIELLHLRTEE